ncbi:serine hydrolase domain-containing protein [Streptomyces sp. NPDC001508]|uniref:serine hydrolase domain-containing protein n=1 Tax=Streptomyces sp. NPDC001508 TaxID=3154656 RepID=UPI003333C274
MPIQRGHGRLRNLAAAAAVAVALACSAGPAAALPAQRTPAQAATGSLQRHLGALVSDGATAALGQVRERGVAVWRGSAGTSDLARRPPVRPDGSFRIGSVTKSFVAAVVLQLAGEGRLRLDDPIGRHLPGVVRDADAVSVRQILNHTSGIYDYTEDPRVLEDPADPAALERWLSTGRWRTWTPAALVALADDPAHAAYFPPGTGWRYSNTDYLLAGLLIEKVTGHTYAQEVTRRILRPLHLTHTRVPGTSVRLPEPHAHAYLLRPGHKPVDITEQNMSAAGPAGEMISTADDLTRFTAALLGGRLLGPAQQRELTTAVDLGPDGGYGLGLERARLSCTTVWGHGGGMYGSTALSFGTPDGRRQLAVSFNPSGIFPTAPQTTTSHTLLETAFCGEPRSPAATKTAISAVPGGGHRHRQ